MRAVLAAAGQPPQLDDFVELVVAIGVADAVQAAAWPAVDGHVETVERIEKPLRRRDLHVETLDLDRLGSAEGWWGDATKALSLLIADNEAALVVEGDGHPRTKLGTRHGEQPFDLEA